MNNRIGLIALVVTALSIGGPVKVASASGHDEFDAVLRAYVNDGVVDYASIEKEGRFFRYIDFLGSANPDEFAASAERLAFWINAYNALAIKGVLEGGSPSSLFGRIGYFKLSKHLLAGRDLSLYDLEHDIIIPFEEPRVHFAIVCASQSCPKLRSEAYVASRLDEQLNESARAFINDVGRNRFEIGAKKAKVSKIFDWFEEDFVRQSGSVQRFLSNYLDDKEIAEQLSREAFRIEYQRYDWGLNGIPPR